MPNCEFALELRAAIDDILTVHLQLLEFSLAKRLQPGFFGRGHELLRQVHRRSNGQGCFRP